MIRTQRTDGFTLVELMIVIVVLGAIAMIVLPSFIGQSDKAHRAAVEHDLISAERMLAALWKETEGQISSDASQLAAQLNEQEPAFQFTAGSGYQQNQVQIQIQNDRVNLRKEARNGEKFALQITFQPHVRAQRLRLTPEGGQRRNIFRSPSFEYDNGYSFGAHGTISRQASYEHAKFGRRSLLVSNHGETPYSEGIQSGNIPVEPNTTYTYSAYVRGYDGASMGKKVRLAVRPYADGNSIGVTSYQPIDDVEALAGEWKRNKLTYTTPSDIDALRLFVVTNGRGDNVGPMKWMLDGVMLEATSKADAFISGDSPDSMWEGTPGNSISVAPAWTDW